MSKNLTVGSETFEYPEQGTNPGWGPDATDWAEAVTDQLTLVSGPNDIPDTTTTILNNQSTAQDIGVGSSALQFSGVAVRSFVVVYAVTRGAAVESGKMEGNFDGTNWVMQHDNVKDAGMDFEITSAGQIQYFSDDDVAGTIRFRARTTDI